MASNFFDQIVKDAKTMEKQLIGPNYPYTSYIATPKQLTMSSDGTISATTNNVDQMINYIQMMIEGTGPANKNPRGSGYPLGNAFFLKSGGHCKENYNNIYIFLCGLLLIYLVQKLMKKK